MRRGLRLLCSYTGGRNRQPASPIPPPPPVRHPLTITADSRHGLDPAAPWLWRGGRPGAQTTVRWITRAVRLSAATDCAGFSTGMREFEEGTSEAAPEAVK